MLKRDISYEDFNGNQITEEFYFNLTKPELLELEVDYKDGFSGFIEAIVAAKDAKELFALFKKIVLISYGVKSEDGKRFIKSEQLSEEFSQTNAFAELFTELASDDRAAAQFVIGILPSDLRGGVTEALEADKKAREEGRKTGIELVSSSDD